MQTARMMMVVVERPESVLLLVPPLVVSVKEETGMLPMFPLANKLLRLF